MQEFPLHSLFEDLGGTNTLRKVHALFYDKLYQDPWLGKFFAGIDRSNLENQQTDFMTSAMGGPQIYRGSYPIPAHQHLFIPEELFNLRHSLLKRSIQEAGIPEHLAQKWLKIDAAFKSGLVKSSPNDCKGRFKTDPIIVIPKPGSL
jgi:hemoglobin